MPVGSTHEGLSGAKPRKDEPISKISVIPYVHGVSHKLKKVAENYGVKVVFSAHNKIGKVCAKVKKMFDCNERTKKECSIKHPSKNQFVECATNAVYNIPLTCGHAYVGQTGRCCNTRLREHLSSLKGRPSTHMAMHCKECGCIPQPEGTGILFKHRNKTAREIVEALWIDRLKDKCISHPSVALLDKEISLLSTYL